MVEDLELLRKSLMQSGDPTCVERTVARLDRLRKVTGGDVADDVAGLPRLSKRITDLLAITKLLMVYETCDTVGAAVRSFGSVQVDHSGQRIDATDRLAVRRSLHRSARGYPGLLTWRCEPATCPIFS